LVGGVYTTAAGDAVRISVSDSYPRDDAIAQRWAEFFDGLVHGQELALLSVYIARPQRCSGSAAASQVVDASFKPDAEALTTIEEDVVEPWNAPRVSTQTVSFTRGSPKVWTQLLTTPLNGELTVTFECRSEAATRSRSAGPTGRRSHTAPGRERISSR
jgi:hypothetical protein